MLPVGFLVVVVVVAVDPLVLDWAVVVAAVVHHYRDQDPSLPSFSQCPWPKVAIAALMFFCPHRLQTKQLIDTVILQVASPFVVIY